MLLSLLLSSMMQSFTKDVYWILISRLKRTNFERWFVHFSILFLKLQIKMFIVWLVREFSWKRVVRCVKYFRNIARAQRKSGNWKWFIRIFYVATLTEVIFILINTNHISDSGFWEMLMPPKITNEYGSK